MIIKVDPLTWINLKNSKSNSIKFNQIPKNLDMVNMKWNSLVFIKNKVCMYLFKIRKVWNVIYWQCFLKAFENQNGKLLRFFWSSHLRSSVEYGILKSSQNSQVNTCVGVYFDKFKCLRWQLLLIFTNEKKPSKYKISNQWFYYFEVSYTNHIS